MAAPVAEPASHQAEPDATPAINGYERSFLANLRNEPVPPTRRRAGPSYPTHRRPARRPATAATVRHGPGPAPAVNPVVRPPTRRAACDDDVARHLTAAGRNAATVVSTVPSSARRASFTSIWPRRRSDTHSRGAMPVMATFTSGAVAEKSRAVCPPRVAQVLDDGDQRVVAGGDRGAGYPLAAGVTDPDLVAEAYDMRFSVGCA
jgi:hypothetical protein